MEEMEDPESTVENTEECEAIRKDLTKAMFHNDEPQIQHYLSLVSEVGCEQELEAEVSSARLLLYRLEKQRDLLSQSLLKYLSKPVITEIRSLGCPPALVKELIMATLLLLGYTEEQAKDWKHSIRILGKYGNDSLMNMLYRVRIRNIPVDVALRAYDVIKYMTIDRVNNVDLACGALYTWVEKTIDAVLANAECDETTSPRRRYPHNSLTLTT